MKIAYFCEPQIGGTFSFFKRMRPLLATRGIDFRCIPPISAENFTGSRFENVEGVEYLKFPADNLPVASKILMDHLDREGYQGVLVLPGCDILCVNLVRYLPARIRSAARIPMITRGTYAPAQAVASHLNFVFGVSKRVADDLIIRYGIEPGKVLVIYNGAEVKKVPNRRTYGRDGQPFRLLYSGRISDLDKGVLLLPEILKKVVDSGIHAQLTIVGAGPDTEKLINKFKRKNIWGFVKMIGNIPLEQVDLLLAETDCFVLPSRFEGCPNALLEAMAAGCASVAARIIGSVDQIIEHAKSGMLAEVANPAAFADAIILLAKDETLCRNMGEEAMKRIREAFTTEHTADGYANAFETMMSMPDTRMSAQSLDAYHVPSALQPTWRTRIPAPIKNMARKWLERFGISS